MQNQTPSETTANNPPESYPLATLAPREPDSAPAGLAISPLDNMTEAQLEAFVMQQQLVANTIAKLRMIAVSLTKPHDWADFKDKPYLEGEGAQRLLAPLAINLDKPDFDVAKHEDHVFVTCILKGHWRKAGISLTEIGARDTLDKFFVGDPETAKQTLYQQFLAAAQGNVQVARMKLVAHLKKAAYMNAVSRVVTGLLGLKGLTWADLAEQGYTSETAGARVEYRKGATKQGRKESAAQLKIVTAMELAKLPEGSEVGCRTRFWKAIAKTKHSELWIGAKQAETTVKFWHQGEFPADLTMGCEVYLRKVRVSDYKGKTQRSVDSADLEVIEAETPNTQETEHGTDTPNGATEPNAGG